MIPSAALQPLTKSGTPSIFSLFSSKRSNGREAHNPGSFWGRRQSETDKWRIIHRNRRNPLQKRLWAEEVRYLNQNGTMQIGNEAEIHTEQIIHSVKSHRAASYFKRFLFFG